MAIARAIVRSRIDARVIFVSWIHDANTFWRDEIHCEERSGENRFTTQGAEFADRD
jgi:hypothetical protein